MAEFEFTATVAASPDDVFEVLTDPERMPRWLPVTEAIESVSGPLTEAGATFVQRGAPGMRRPGRIVAVSPPESLHLHLKGGGERVDARFTIEPRGDGTHVRLVVSVQNAPPVIGPLLDRLGGARLDRRLWRPALEGLQRELGHQAVIPHPGEVYAVRGGGYVRVVRIIETDERWVHLELFAGSWKGTAPSPLRELPPVPPKPKDAFAIRPLDPTVRDSVSLTRRGSAALLVDGGFGLGHLPVTHAAFRAAEPERTAIEVPPSSVGAREVESWRRREGVAFGDLVEPKLGAFYTVALQAMGIDAIGFGVVKLLKTQFRGVHLRVYSNVFAQRPSAINEEELEMIGLELDVDPSILADGAEAPALALPSRPFGMEHLPLKHATFTALQPEFVRIALVHPDELRGYEHFKRARGSFF